MTDFETPESRLTRRDALRLGAAGAVTALGTGAMGTRAFGAEPEYGPFYMGIQSYSLRAFNTDTALDMTRKLGLRSWEAFPAHIPQTTSPVVIQGTLSKLKAAGVRLYAWGVVGFDGNEAKARETFEFAKAMGIRVISADPSPESMPILDRLVQQYKIAIAIHNHGPGARFSSIAGVWAAIKDHHPLIGACIDTGHFLRSGEDPVEAVRTFGKRTFGVHLKDVKSRTTFTEIGQGDMDTVGLFRALRKIGYKSLVALEYEEHENEPGKYIDLCLAATRDAISKAVHQG